MRESVCPILPDSEGNVKRCLNQRREGYTNHACPVILSTRITPPCEIFWYVNGVGQMNRPNSKTVMQTQRVILRRVSSLIAFPFFRGISIENAETSLTLQIAPFTLANTEAGLPR